MFNTTHSPHAFATAVHSIPMHTSYGHMVVSSATQVVFLIRTAQATSLPLIWRESSRHVFDSSTVDAAAQGLSLVCWFRWRNASAGAEVITDDNMIVEYKYGRGFNRLKGFQATQVLGNVLLVQKTASQQSGQNGLNILSRILIPIYSGLTKIRTRRRSRRQYK